MWQAVDYQSKEDGYHLTVKGTPIKTSSGHALIVPYEPLAEAIVKEFHCQEEKIEPDTMPHYGMACLALDVWPHERDDQMEQLLAYLETELLCYRADGPQALVERQARMWNPLLEWAQAEWGVPFVVTVGIMPVPQAPDMKEQVVCFFEGWDDFQMAALQQATYQCGSIVTGYALVSGKLTPQEAHAVAHLDECYQQEVWGGDEAVERRLSRSLARMEQLQAYGEMVKTVSL